MKILLITFLGIITASGIVLLIDIVPAGRRWFSRIHIGQWSNLEEWQCAVEEVLLKQLKKVPVVPISDNTRFTVIERIKGTYKSRNLQNWQQAVLLLGANKLFDRKGVSRQVQEFIDLKINSGSGEWIEWNNKADSALLAYAILSSPVCDKQKVKPAMRQVAEMLTDLADKYGTVPYNLSVPNIRFVDTIGMICPFLFMYGQVYSSEREITTARRQIEEYVRYGIHLEFNLPVHCFDTGTGAPLGIYGWGRGCGWWAIGLMDSYLSFYDFTRLKSCACDSEYNDEDTISDIQVYLLDQMTGLARTLVVFQMENGAWDRQLVLKENGESSATAMLAWFMANMYLITNNEQYKKSADMARSFLARCTRRNGTVDYAQGDTKGIGFYSAKLDAMPAVQGFTGRLKK